MSFHLQAEISMDTCRHTHKIGIILILSNNFFFLKKQVWSESANSKAAPIPLYTHLNKLIYLLIHTNIFQHSTKTFIV